jgi:hypothetical protein
LHRIHVVLAEMPRMLKDIVRTVLDAEPHVELVSTSVTPRELICDRALERADVVILAEEEPMRDDYAELLYAHPRLRLVTIGDHGISAFLYELRPHRIPLGELSPEALRNAVRMRPQTPREEV